MATKVIEAVFDKDSHAWMEDPGYNLAFLQGQQQWANVRFQRMGHLFLNEVYDYLGLPRTREGQIFGWLSSAGPSYVDFGFDKDADFMQGVKTDVRLFMSVQENAHLFI